VALGVRATFATAAVVAVMVLASCGGGGGNSQGATLSGDSCVYEGDTSLDAGKFTINLENRTEFFGAFALARLSNGKTIDDLQPYLEKAKMAQTSRK
jgi:hypothetical protein